MRIRNAIVITCAGLVSSGLSPAKRPGAPDAEERNGPASACQPAHRALQDFSVAETRPFRRPCIRRGQCR